jgi:hypothetical protein
MAEIINWLDGVNIWISQEIVLAVTNCLIGEYLIYIGGSLKPV